MTSTHFTHLRLLNDENEQHQNSTNCTNEVDLRYKWNKTGDDDVLLRHQFSTHSKRGDRLFYLSIVLIISLVSLALTYNIDTYLAISNKTTDVSIDITREIEIPVVEISLDHSTVQQWSTKMITDIDLDLELLHCDMFRDNRNTRYVLLVNKSKIVNKGTIIYDSFYNYSNDADGKYSFATTKLELDSTNINFNYTIYGYMEFIREYQLMSENGWELIDNDTEVITIYYKINNFWMTLDKVSTLFQTIKHTYDNFQNNDKNIIYIIEYYSFAGIYGANYDTVWMIPIINSPKTFSKLQVDDVCSMTFDINSFAMVKNTTDKETFVNDLLESQYYTYSTIPLSQFIQDGSESYYFSTNTFFKNTFSYALYSKFSSKNTITNKKIDSFDVDIQTSAFFSADEFWKYEVTRLNYTKSVQVGKNSSGSNNVVSLNISNSFVEYLVTYHQLLFIQVNTDAFDYKYVTKKLLTIWDVLGNTGGMFSIIKVVIIGIISFITFGTNVPKLCQKCSKYCNKNKCCLFCACDCDKCLEIIFGGIAPYQKYNKTDQAKLLRFLKENDYSTKHEYERQIQELKAKVQKLEAKLQAIDPNT